MLRRTVLAVTCLTVAMPVARAAYAQGADDPWWPEPLTDLGVERPTDTDNRVREPWEHAAALQRHIYETQSPPAGAHNHWYEVERLLHVGRTTFDRLTDWADFDELGLPSEQYDAISQRLGGWISAAEAEQVLANRPEILERIDTTLAAIDRELGWYIDPLLRADTPRWYAVPVPPAIDESRWATSTASQLTFFRGYPQGRAADAIARGDVQGAARFCELVSTLSAGASHHPDLLVHQNAMTIQSINALRAIDALHGRVLTEDDIDLLTDAFLAFQPARASDTVRGFRITTLAQMDSLVTRASNAGQTPPLARADEHAFTHAIYDAIATSLDDRAPDDTRARAQKVWEWFVSEEGEDAWAYDHAVVLERCHQSLARWRNEPAMARAFTNAILTMLAIERHRLTAGELPASLDDLPDVAQAHAIDPFRTDGARLGYIVDATDQPTALGTGYRLYTVGADGEDNLARPADRALDALRNDPDGAGTDYVFSPTRPAN